MGAGGTVATGAARSVVVSIVVVSAALSAAVVSVVVGHGLVDWLRLVGCWIWACLGKMGVRKSKTPEEIRRCDHYFLT